MQREEGVRGRCAAPIRGGVLPFRHEARAGLRALGERRWPRMDGAWRGEETPRVRTIKGVGSRCVARPRIMVMDT